MSDYKKEILTMRTGGLGLKEGYLGALFSVNYYGEK